MSDAALTCTTPAAATAATVWPLSAGAVLLWVVVLPLQLLAVLA